jgi:hypothetical protein
MAKEELLTSGKIAEKFNIKPAQVKKAIEELGLAPDAKKGVCCYYTLENAQKIKDAVK